MDSNIAYMGPVPDWDESDEQLTIGNVELKRFITLAGVITNLLSHCGDRATVDVEVVSAVILLLPSLSSARDFYDVLHDRFDLHKTTNSTNLCREQKQLHIMAILQYWLKSDSALCDLSGSLIDSISEFVEQALSVGSAAVATAASKLKVHLSKNHLMN